MKYVSLDFDVNYFIVGEPKFHVFGFTVGDPNETIEATINDEEQYSEILENLEDFLEATVDAIFFPVEQFLGVHIYELDESDMQKIREGVQLVTDWFTKKGGVVGPIIEIIGGEEITDHNELKSKLGITKETN